MRMERMMRMEFGVRGSGFGMEFELAPATNASDPNQPILNPPNSEL